MESGDVEDGSGVTEMVKGSPRKEFSRREFLKDSALVAMGVAGLAPVPANLTSRLGRLVAGLRPASAKDTIVVGWEADMTTLDPAKTVGAHELRYAMQVFEGMWRLEGSSTQIRPSLATQWRNSGDGKEWTFTLRPGVRFHDGTPLRAQDVAWSYERWMDPKHPYSDPPYGVPQYNLRALDKVLAVDDRTVKFVLKRVDALFESNMLWPNAGGIVSPEAVKKAGKRGFATKPVGTGPWRVAEWTKGVRLILERNNDHWGNPPVLRRLIIKPVPEDAVRLGQLKTGDVDVIVALPPQFITSVLSDPSLKLMRSVASHLWWVALNLREKPLSDKRVRQALNYGVNKEAIVRALLKGGAQLARGPMMVGSWAEDTTLNPYPHDPRRARELLAAAGYPNGFRTRFWVPESGSGMLAPKDIAVMVQAQLKEIGVVVDIVTQEWTSYVGQYGAEGLAPKGKPAYGMAEMSWNTPPPDPAHYMDATLKTESFPPAGYNPGFYSNPEFDRLVTEAGRIMDREKRKRLYQRAQRIAYEDAPWIFMFSAENLVAARSNVQGLVANPSPWWLDFSGVYVQS